METLFRLFGFALEFCWVMSPVAILGGFTWRLTR